MHFFKSLTTLDSSKITLEKGGGIPGFRCGNRVVSNVWAPGTITGRGSGIIPGRDTAGINTKLEVIFDWLVGWR